MIPYFTGPTNDGTFWELMQKKKMAPIIEKLLTDRIIVPCPTSSCNTPLLLVKEAAGKSWWLVHDLRAVKRSCVCSNTGCTQPSHNFVFYLIILLIKYIYIFFFSLKHWAGHFTVEISTVKSLWWTNYVKKTLFLNYLTRHPYCYICNKLILAGLALIWTRVLSHTTYYKHKTAPQIKIFFQPNYPSLLHV